jgi:hypothetical protein
MVGPGPTKVGSGGSKSKLLDGVIGSEPAAPFAVARDARNVASAGIAEAPELAEDGESFGSVSRAWLMDALTPKRMFLPLAATLC